MPTPNPRNRPNSDESDNTWGQTEQQEHQGVLDANGQLTVTLPTGSTASTPTRTIASRRA